MSKKKPAYIDGKFVGDTLSISVKPHYQKEYEFLKSHHNRSGLICELIRQYLEGAELSLGFQKPIQNAQQPNNQPENRTEEKEETKGENKELHQQEKSKQTKESDNKNSQQKDGNEVPKMTIPSFAM